MKVKELIKLLQSHHNPEADIDLKVNLFNPDDEETDVDCTHLEVWNIDEFNEGSITLFISNYEAE